MKLLLLVRDEEREVMSKIFEFSHIKSTRSYMKRLTTIDEMKIVFFYLKFNFEVIVTKFVVKLILIPGDYDI